MGKLKANLFSHLHDYLELYFPDMPEEHEAIVYQWIHALVNNQPLFGKDRGISKSKIINSLKRHNILDDVSQLRSLLTSDNSKDQAEPEFSFIDLFAGIGGMRLGFEQASGVCVFSSEFEKNARETYLQNHAEQPFGDITKIRPIDIPSHDVLVAGFPCQPFSHAGLKKGIRDTRGTLFHNIAKILEIKKPKVALLENVKGLISHDKGYTLQTILRTLTKIGYQCNIPQEIIDGNSLELLQSEAKKMVLKSIDFGVPQNRQRIYIVLWKKSRPKSFTYPSNSGVDTKVASILEENPPEKYTISNRLWDGHQRRKLHNKINGKGFGYGLVGPESPYTNTISARYYKDGSEILIEQVNKNPRKLTPREAALLQGFPKTFICNKSDVQAYKQFGNSVTVPVIYSLALQIKKQLLR